jgi:hypothetical protein
MGKSGTDRYLSLEGFCLFRSSMRIPRMKKMILLCTALASLLLIPACGTASEVTNSPQPPPTARNTPVLAAATRTPLPPATARNTPESQRGHSADDADAAPQSATNNPESVLGETCNPNSERVGMNTSLSRSLQGGADIESCEVYCLWVPEGSSLEIGISGFDVDLDLYVDTYFSVLQFEVRSRWESNAFGIGDEQVAIQNPGGRYYIQVCSYEGLSSGFILYNQFTP